MNAHDFESRGYHVSEVINALTVLRPSAECYFAGGEDLVWDADAPIPSEDAFITAMDAARSERAKTAYREQRAAEYPDFREYIDGIVKGDQAQVQAYIDACLAVKAKYPKPE
jgi:hypothetical protein